MGATSTKNSSRPGEQPQLSSLGRLGPTDMTLGGGKKPM